MLTVLLEYINYFSQTLSYYGGIICSMLILPAYNRLVRNTYIHVQVKFTIKIKWKVKVNDDMRQQTPWNLYMSIKTPVLLCTDMHI